MQGRQAGVDPTRRFTRTTLCKSPKTSKVRKDQMCCRRNGAMEASKKVSLAGVGVHKPAISTTMPKQETLQMLYNCDLIVF